jgi:hypothetical protein
VITTEVNYFSAGFYVIQRCWIVDSRVTARTDIESAFCLLQFSSLKMACWNEETVMTFFFHFEAEVVLFAVNN